MISSFIFFFKQKTAYEMRISDWSSDVCSSDLGKEGAGAEGTGPGEAAGARPDPHRRTGAADRRHAELVARRRDRSDHRLHDRGRNRGGLTVSVLAGSRPPGVQRVTMPQAMRPPASPDGSVR